MNQRLGTIVLRILVVALTTLLGAAISDRVMGYSQKRYVATVTMQLRDIPPGEPRKLLEETPVDPEALLKVLTSDAILGSAATALGVPAAVVPGLHKSVTVRALRNTQLVQISVTVGDPKTAADLANSLAEAFQLTVMKTQKKEIRATFNALQAEVRLKREQVAELRANLAAMRLSAGITDLNPDTLDNGQSLADAILALQQKVATLRALSEQLASLTDDQVLDEIARDTAFGKTLDPTLSQISADRRGGLTKLAEFETAGVGPEDPRLRSLRAKLAVMEKQLSDFVPILRQRLEAALKANEGKLRAADGIPSGPQPTAEMMARYREAKTKYLEARKSADEKEMRLRMEQIDISMPRNPAVIWERAEPPAAPDSGPRIMLVLGTLLGLLVGIALAFLPRPGITSGIVLLLLGVASFPRWAGSSPSQQPLPEKKFIPRVSVGGEVKAPQLLDFAEDLTVLRVINAAGGFTEYADRKKVRLLRDGKVIVVDAIAIVANPSKDIPLKPGDSIEVAQSFW